MMSLTHPSALRYACVAGSLLAGIHLSAQETDSVNDVIELSPFEVATDDYTGYQATTTQAGSRLNSKVGDLAAAITIMTPEFLEDIGATNLQDALVFAPNTEYQEFRDGNPDNQAQFNNTIYRVRGFEGGTSGLSRGFFRTALSADTYNTERLTFSRGPNSILYGSGAVYGIIDNAPKQARYENKNKVGFRVDDEGSYRVTVDFNRELIEGKLALRVAALKEDIESWQSSVTDTSERIYIAARIDPTPSTTIHLNFESSDEFNTITTPFTASENYRLWQDAGSPLYDPSLGGAFPLGTQSAGSNRYEAAGFGSSRVYNRAGTAVSRGFRVDGFTMYPANQDALYAEDTVPFAPNQSRSQKGEVFSASIEQQVTENFTLLLAYNNESIEFDTRLSNITPSVFYDVNSHFVDGSPNPNAGRPYFQKWENRWNFLPTDTETIRLTAAYDLDLTENSKWLGRHRIAALAEREEATTLHDKFDLRNHTSAEFNAINGTNINTDPTNGQNIVQDRLYFTPGDPSSINVDFFDFASFVSPRNLSPGVNAAWTRNRGPNRDRFETDTLSASAQSFWFSDRLITTFGVRRDEAKQFTAPNSRQADRQFIDPLQQTFPDNPGRDLTFDTSSVGAVLKVTDWFSLTYNKSDNVSRLSSRRDYFGNTVPAPSGEGEDYGFRVDLMEGKLSLGVTWFDTNLVNDENLGQRNSAGGARLSMPDAIARIQETLNPSIYDATLSSTGNISFVRDFEATGTEVSVIYTPIRNWRMALNVGQKENTQTNMGKAYRAYLDVYRAEFEANAATALVRPNAGAGIFTVGDALADSDRTLGFRRINEGRRSAAEREWTVNYVTSYDLPDDGPFKGFRVGATSQWGSKAAVGYFKDSAGAFDVNRPIYSGQRFDVGLFARYSRPIMDDKAEFSVQLNIRNLLDDRLTAVERVEDRFGDVGPAGNIVTTRYYLRDPRSYELSCSLEF